MITRKVLGKLLKDYAADARLVKHMQRELHLAKKLQEISATKKDVPKSIENEKGALSTSRTRILDDIVFQAMADITFFFDTVGKHREIQKAFDDDIKELLGVKRENPKDTPYGFMFEALVAGMLLVNFKTKKDFRLRLNNRLQHLIWDKVQRYLDDVHMSTMNAYGISGSDFQRVLGWTEMLMFDMDQRDEYTIPNVIPVRRHPKTRLPNPTKEEKEMINDANEKYQKSLKRNLPSRTFSLVSIED